MKIIPTRIWSAEALTPVNFLSLPSTPGRLDVNLEITAALKGAFKTAHPGFIIPDPNGVLPPPLSGKICIKQVYFSGEGGVVKRYRPTEEQTFIHSEVCCLDWAKILLDLTYQFVETQQEDKGDFPGIIPKLRFVEAAIAECDLGKIFLVEEWIDTSTKPFMKYINNGRAVSCVPQHASEEVQNIANFLCFAQHVQYQVTKKTIFTSDYQGMFLIVKAEIIS